MGSAWNADSLISFTSDSVGKFRRNYLKQAVFEVRFPTLFELAERKPPQAFVSALRKDYPHLELNNEFTLGINAQSGADNVHILRSSKLQWVVSLKQSSLSLETSKYTSYKELRERAEKLIDAANKVIDSDFFTRIGLRFVNVIETAPNDVLEDWVNPLLVGPIVSGKIFSGVNELAGRIQVLADDGGCLLQHGLRHKNSSTDAVLPNYVVDIDSFRTDIEVAQSLPALDAMHAQSFLVFDWTLGTKARSFLSSSR